MGNEDHPVGEIHKSTITDITVTSEETKSEVRNIMDVDELLKKLEGVFVNGSINSQEL